MPNPLTIRLRWRALYRARLGWIRNEGWSVEGIEAILDCKEARQPGLAGLSRASRSLQTLAPRVPSHTDSHTRFTKGSPSIRRLR